MKGLEAGAGSQAKIPFESGALQAFDPPKLLFNHQPAQVGHEGLKQLLDCKAALSQGPSLRTLARARPSVTQ